MVRIMSVLGEIFEIIAELKKTFAYRYDIPNIYGIADFRRNEFIFYGKKAIREFIKRHEPYKYPYRKTELASKLSKAIMLLWIYPELFNELDQEVTAIYKEIKGSE